MRPCEEDIFRVVAERFGIGPAPFDALLEVRAGSRPLDPTQAGAWFESYLSAISQLAEKVEQL